MRLGDYDWTEEKVKILTDMWKSGSTGAEISVVLKTSRCSVMGKASRLGLRKKAKKGIL